MKFTIAALPVLAASIACLESQKVMAFSLTSNASVTQFETPDTQSFTSNSTIFQALPTVSSTRVSTDGTVITSATATPSLLTASFSTTGSGIARPTANAQFKDVGLVFQNNQALINLIGSSGTGLDLLLNFDVTYRLATLPTPGLFSQSLAFVDANFVASSYGLFSSKNGRADSTNAAREHTFGNTGVFSGLPEGGGSTTVQLPIRLTPNVGSNGLSVVFTAFADVNGLALQNGFANGDISVSLPDLPSFVTLLNGTSASTAGLQYALNFSVASTNTGTGGSTGSTGGSSGGGGDPGDSTGGVTEDGSTGDTSAGGGATAAVPEPSEIAGTVLAIGLLGMSLRLTKKVRSIRSL